MLLNLLRSRLLLQGTISFWVVNCAGEQYKPINVDLGLVEKRNSRTAESLAEKIIPRWKKEKSQIYSFVTSDKLDFVQKTVIWSEVVAWREEKFFFWVDGRVLWLLQAHDVIRYAPRWAWKLGQYKLKIYKPSSVCVWLLSGRQNGYSVPGVVHGRGRANKLGFWALEATQGGRTAMDTSRYLRKYFQVCLSESLRIKTVQYWLCYQP